MRFVLTFGRFTLFDFTMFRIEEEEDVVVVHHHYSDDEEDKPEGPDMFGGGKG